MGVGTGSCTLELFRSSNLFCERMLVTGRDCSTVPFGLFFLGLAFIQGLDDFWARRSFSLAVPYFSNLAGHLLASAGWLLSVWLFAMQLVHLMSWGQRPPSVVSIVSPYSRARAHLWQFVGLVSGWSFSSCWSLHRQQRCTSVHLWDVWFRLQQFLHCVTSGRSWKARRLQSVPKAVRDFWFRICRAANSSVSANTSED